jgi:hypothetical protein
VHNGPASNGDALNLDGRNYKLANEFVFLLPFRCDNAARRSFLAMCVGRVHSRVAACSVIDQ